VTCSKLRTFNWYWYLFQAILVLWSYPFKHVTEIQQAGKSTSAVRSTKNKLDKSKFFRVQTLELPSPGAVPGQQQPPGGSAPYTAATGRRGSPPAGLRAAAATPAPPVWPTVVHPQSSQDDTNQTFRKAFWKMLFSRPKSRAIQTIFNICTKKNVIKLLNYARRQKIHCVYSFSSLQKVIS
jgi:hypothetical protein